MHSVGFCGEWFISTCDKKLVAIHTKQPREPFVFDCSTAEKKPKTTKNDAISDDGGSEETGSDRVLACSASPSGKMLALTDDTKRLLLFQCEASWKLISLRWVVRRCTALVFSQAEDDLLVADKSGDVYSFSVADPQREGELKLGHLSMLLAMTLSPDDKYIITADRDEKIRVSHLRCPYNIQSFCLGHEQFVSALLIPPPHPQYLLSGSGDGTIKLWDYESGQKLQNWDLKEHEETTSNKEEKPAVCGISSSPDGGLIAVQCDRIKTVYLFTLEPVGKQKLVPQSQLSLPHCPLDMAFDPECRLWVLMDSRDAPLQIFSRRHRDSWERDLEIPELNTINEAFRTFWETREDSPRTSSRFQHLYKMTFDNVAVYLQKKQHRLNEQQKKRTKTRGTNKNKKAKKDSA